MPRTHLQVTGKVQGVGFRWYVRVAARRLQLAGWVMNRRDGTVEIAAEGRQDKLDDLKRVVARGPDGAMVEEVKELEPVADELEFPFVMKR
jgi:acylphosphatase